MERHNPSIQGPDPFPERPNPSRGRPKRLAAYSAFFLLAAGIGAFVALLLARGTGDPARAASGGRKETSGHAGMQGMEAAPGKPEGETPSQRIRISYSRQQLIGVRAETIGYQTFEATIRTVGTFAYDETRIAQIHTKISGWAEQVPVGYVGRPVRRDEPLFTVYSPELLSTQDEYLAARRSLPGEPARAQMIQAATGSLRSAALERLKLWGISGEQLQELQRSGKAQTSLTLTSPFDGIVLERNVFPGQYVTPEMTAFKIADLSNIWVFGSIFEYELPLVKIGQEARIEFPYGQVRQALQGKITFVSPWVDPETRRVRIRAEFANPGMEFRPGEFVTFVLRTGGEQGLAIPKEAVIDTGTRRYAILALPDGYFEPRDIRVGAPGDQYYPLLAGLQEGDRVVTSAQFLIDSETNLQQAMQSMIGMPGMKTEGSGGEMKGMEMPGEQPAKGPK